MRTFDALTLCLNRGATMTTLDAVLRDGQQKGWGTCVVFVDLDRFKDINDRLGHAAGDKVLVRAADTLKRAAGPKAVVGRIGGDEFLVIVPETKSGLHAARFARRIDAAMGQQAPRDASSACSASVWGSKFAQRPELARSSLERRGRQRCVGRRGPREVGHGAVATPHRSVYKRLGNTPKQSSAASDGQAALSGGAWLDGDFGPSGRRGRDHTGCRSEI